MSLVLLHSFSAFSSLASLDRYFFSFIYLFSVLSQECLSLGGAGCEKNYLLILWDILNSLHVNTNIDDDGGGENKCLKITDAVSFSSALSNREKLK